MSKEDGNGHDKGGTATATKVPHVIVTFDPTTYAVNVSGNTPNLAFGKAILQMAVDALERQLQEAAMQKRVALMPASILSELGRG